MGWEAARILDGTINSQVLVATDQKEAAHFRVFKLYKFIKSGRHEDAHAWMQDRGIQLIFDRYAGTTQYDETRGSIEYGTLGSGEAITMIPSVLGINEGDRHVWIVYVDRTISAASWHEYIVFFFHNGSDTREIDKNLPLEITNYATKMF